MKKDRRTKKELLDEIKFLSRALDQMDEMVSDLTVNQAGLLIKFAARTSEIVSLRNLFAGRDKETLVSIVRGLLMENVLQGKKIKEQNEQLESDVLDFLVKEATTEGGLAIIPDDYAIDNEAPNKLAKSLNGLQKGQLLMLCDLAKQLGAEPNQLAPFYCAIFCEPFEKPDRTK